MSKRTASRNQRHQGFTLVEMAVVLMILGILLSGVLVAVGDSTDSIRISNTNSQLDLIAEALYGFAQANGRLPCPATDTSNGVEDPAGGGTCTVIHGLVPNVTLGIYGNTNTDGMLLDAWQNPIRYSVSAATTDSSARAFTTAAGLSELFNDGELTTTANVYNNLFEVCDDNVCTTTLTDNAPAIILSMGEDWGTFTSTDETENAETTLGSSDYEVSDDLRFVDTEYNEDNFDDQIFWLSPHILFSRLIQAGRLP